MDLLNGNVKKVYFKYLTASFGSALIVAIYSIVDCAMVGQYEGANGVAALATVAPIWNIIYSLGMLFGIGGAVLMSTARGNGDKEKGDSIYSISFIGAAVIAVIIWIVIWIFGDNLLRFFGADDTLLVYANKYLKWIKVTVPLFVFGQFFAAFIRNDHAPLTATIAVLSGGIFNVVGDYFFVFVLDMGITGAGLATALGQVLSFTILCSHFFTKKCTLRFGRPRNFILYMKDIISTGFATFFIDIAMGILSVMFNNQIMRYSGSAALAVYGVIINVSTLVQSCAYGIGQAAQPIISVNYGAKKQDRIKEASRYSMYSIIVVSAVWTVISMAIPTALIKIFMTPTAEVLRIGPAIIRCYSLSFILLPFNIYSTYYFQAVLKTKESFLVSILRGMILSGICIFAFPVLMGANSLWFAMPVTELITTIYIIILIKKTNK